MSVANQEELDMNPFSTHPQEQGISYNEHYRFAMGIAYRLLISVMVFALHLILPFIPIAPRHDLEKKTTVYLMERNQWIESGNKVIHADKQPDLGGVE